METRPYPWPFSSDGADMNAKNKKGFTVFDMGGGQAVRQALLKAKR